MILARMLNVWLLLLASFSFLCTKGVDPANPSTSTKTNLLHTPPFVGLLHGASPACCFCRCCGLTKDHTVQCVYLSSCFGIIKLVGCVQETNGQYVSDLAFCFCLAEPIPHLLYLQSLEGWLPEGTTATSFSCICFPILGWVEGSGLEGPQGCYADGSYTPMVRSHNLHRKVIIFHYGVSGGEGDRNLYEEFRLRGWSVHQVPCALLPSCVGVCCWGGQVANCLLKKTLFPRSSLFISWNFLVVRKYKWKAGSTLL